VQHAPVDLERLNEFAGGSAENLEELIGLYLKQTTQQLEEIRAALSENNAERASRVAHSCAGASATCGIAGIVPLLRKMELLCQEADTSTAGGLMPAIEGEFERLKLYLQTHKPIALAG
jgi:HPt (histidine-containing phosphotransfer) domain-containing protein